jgi:preprotein translocase subunit SecE
MATKTRPRTTRTKSSERHSNSNSRFARLAVLQRLFKDTVSELKKITWPDRDTTRNLTIVVIAISVTLGLALGGVDALFVRLWQAIP